MATTISYNGRTIHTVSGDETLTLPTNDKIMTGDLVFDTDGDHLMSVNYGGNEIINEDGVGAHTMTCGQKIMQDDVTGSFIEVLGGIQTVSGNDSITLNNAAARPLLNLAQEGAISQNDTPTPSTPVDIVCNNGALKLSPNLLDPSIVTSGTSSGITISEAADGTITASGSLESGIYAQFTYTMEKTLPAGTYTVSLNNPTALAAGALVGFGINENVSVGSRACGLNATNATKTFTIDDGDVANRLVIRLNSDLTGFSMKIQVERGETPTAYRPFGAVYTDGNPEVISVGGKNLDGDELVGQGYASTGAISTSTTFCGTLRKLKVKEGEKYTVSFGGFTTTGISGVFVCTWKTDGTWNMRQAISSTGVTTYTIPEGIGEANFTLYKTGGVTIDSTAWMQVERGASATQYVPYRAPQTFSAVDLFAVGDIADEVDIISGTVTRRVGITTSAQTWTKGSSADASGNAVFYCNFGNMATGTGKTLLCTHFAQAAAGSYTTLTEGGFLYNATTGNVYFDGGSATTVAQWEAWLADNPIIIVYPLATPTTESAAPQPITLGDGTNIIDVTANVSPIPISATYRLARSA